jgi:hypothetical protein
MMGSSCDCNGIISVLAFFPVVAISTNLSTKLLKHKANKKNRKIKIIPL